MKIEAKLDLQAKQESPKIRLRPIEITKCGLIPMGAVVAKYALKKQGIKIVGDVDIDPAQEANVVPRLRNGS